LIDAKALVERAGDDTTDEQAFAVRSELVHEWRKFLFRDPGLPAELLPDDWAGTRAAAFFDFHAERLSPAAGRFVDNCLILH
jgi:phenylacetic acid degradation operon negative regulatory protein